MVRLSAMGASSRGFLGSGVPKFKTFEALRDSVKFLNTALHKPQIDREHLKGSIVCGFDVAHPRV